MSLCFKTYLVNLNLEVVSIWTKHRGQPVLLLASNIPGLSSSAVVFFFEVFSFFIASESEDYSLLIKFTQRYQKSKKLYLFFFVSCARKKSCTIYPGSVIKLGGGGGVGGGVMGGVMPHIPVMALRDIFLYPLMSSLRLLMIDFQMFFYTKSPPFYAKNLLYPRILVGEAGEGKEG